MERSEVALGFVRALGKIISWVKKSVKINLKNLLDYLLKKIPGYTIVSGKINSSGEIEVNFEMCTFIFPTIIHV